MRRALLGVALLALAVGARADDTWRVAAADLRVPLRVEGDLYARTDAAPAIVLDFNTLLGSERVLADGSLTLVDAADGQTLPLQLAQDAELRYASGNPVLRLQWTMPALAAFATRPLHLYCRTVPPGDAAAWQPLAETFTPGGDRGFATSFEAPDPVHADWPQCFTPAGRDQPGETSERVWSDQQARTGPQRAQRRRITAQHIGAIQRRTSECEVLQRGRHRHDDGPPAQTVKLLPQPQVVLALGLRITNCAPPRPSL